MTNVTLCHWALTGAMSHLTTLKNLRKAYADEGDEGTAQKYAQAVEEHKALIKEIKQAYRQAEREEYGMACASEAYFRWMYGEA